MESINRTAALEALSPFLDNPRRTVIQAEVFTSGIILLLLVQLILGSLRRQSTGLLVQAGTWVTCTVSFPAIAYTLGLMQSSPVKNAMYPIWAVSLVVAAGCTNAVRVYELDDNRQWKRGLFNILQYFVYASLISFLLIPTRMGIERYSSLNKVPHKDNFSDLKSPPSVINILSCIVLLMGGIREVACLLVDRGYYRARRVAKFLKKLPAAAVAADGDPAIMNLQGYKYPVKIGGIGSDVTINQIWHSEGSLLSSGTDHCKGLKDRCQAFAMYQLLKQRYYGMTLADECLVGTRDFLLKGLLHTEGGCERAFRIIEMELGFCHDPFFTKHAIIFEYEAGFLFFFFLRIFLIFTVVSFVRQNTLSIQTTSAIIEVHNKRADDIITLLVLTTILLVEIVGIYVSFKHAAILLIAHCGNYV